MNTPLWWAPLVAAVVAVITVSVLLCIANVRQRGRHVLRTMRRWPSRRPR